MAKAGEGAPATGMSTPPNPAIKVQKMKADDNPEAYLNLFECMAQATRWPEAQWASVLVLCLVGPAQQSMDTLPASNMADYLKSVRCYPANPES